MATVVWESSPAWRSSSIRSQPSEAIDILIRRVAPGNGPSPLVFAEVRHVGGAVARVNSQANAYDNRDASLLLQMIGVTPTPEAHRHLAQYTVQIKSQLRPYMTGGVYMNFLEGEESQQRVADGFSPEAYRHSARSLNMGSEILPIYVFSPMMVRRTWSILEE